MSKLNQIKIPINLSIKTPEQWVILRIPTEDNIDVPYYKVFTGWRGGYLDGDRWRLNSGVTRVEEDDDYYYFYGYSGSCYKCHKNAYGLKEEQIYFSSYVQGVLENILENPEMGNIQVEVMPENSNWDGLTR